MKLHLESYCASSKKYLFSVLTMSPLICVSVYGVGQVTHGSGQLIQLKRGEWGAKQKPTCM